MGNQKGFTLIELVVVIVILGILAAVAVPKFIDIKDDANIAALDGVVGAMGSAMALNYAANLVNTSKGVTVDNCDDIESIMGGGTPDGYTVTAKAITGATLGSTETCTVTQDATSDTGTFTAIRATVVP